MTPRAYQREAIRRVIAYAAEHPTGRVLLVIPMRGGKTLVGAHLALVMAIRRGLRVLWLVHVEELLEQAAEHLIAVGIPRGSIGVIKSGRSSDPEAKVQIASEQTLDRRRDRLPVAHLVITDESHRDTAPRRRRLKKAYPHAFFIGLTGVPKPPPQRELGEDFDVLMVVVQPSELIHDGYLEVPTIFVPDKSSIPDLRGLRSIGGDYRVTDLEPLMLRQSLLDDQVNEWARLAEERTTIALPVSVLHSKALAARFQASGVKARHIDGDTKSDERMAIVAGLKDGTIPVVCSVSVLNEGTNIPRVKCILGVRPTMSLTLYLQSNMRCATPCPGTLRPRILDGVGNSYRFGYPYADRRWSLVNAESGEVVEPGAAVLRRCPACGAMMPGGTQVCTNCQNRFQAPTPAIPDVPLNLHELEPGNAEINEERKRLVAFAVERRFADPESWADNVLEKKHGATAA